MKLVEQTVPLGLVHCFWAHVLWIIECLETQLDLLED